MILAVARHLLESTLFAFVVLIAVACLRHRSASNRYTLLLCAALKFALPVQWFIAMGALLRAIVPASEVQVALPLGVNQMLSSYVISVQAPETGALLTFIFFAVWFTVAALFLFAWLRKLIAPINVSDTVSHAGIVALERMKFRMGIVREVRLKTSAEDLEPRLCGLLHPTVVLPKTLSQRLLPEELDAVILHELAHVRRRDNLTRAFVHMLTCVFWFFPLLSWLERRIDIECELACDELVLFCGARPREYLDGILKICQFYALEPIAGSSNVSGSNLKRRMEFIMSPRIRKPGFLSTGMLAGLLFSCLAATAMITGFSTSTPSQTHTAAAGSTRPPVRCVSASVEYPEGTVLKVGRGPEQMCVESRHRPLWVNTSDNARERSKQLISLPEPSPFLCEPTAPDGKYCTCQGHGIFSPGATVNSKHGALVCAAVGGKWLTYKKH